MEIECQVLLISGNNISFDRIVQEIKVLEFHELTSKSISALEAQTNAHQNTWRFGDEDSWSVDQDEGVIRWFFPDGVIAEAPVQFVGTLNPIDSSFLWAWDHPDIQGFLVNDSQLAKEYGETNGIEELCTRKVLATESDAWRFAAITNFLAGKNGAYRAELDGPMLFMIFGEVKISKAS